ncbi:GNAT family N-acetyltransferase [Rummeliibacillus pycnus]|uniref:GNAT family N-acetyltransferase n=1 Tax=Rummeliibacillus pycnus TaxID=101070 RepID=UPI0037C869FF
MFKIRFMRENEKEFFMKMLYESIFIEKEKKPPIDKLLNTDELKKYHQNWGRKGDKALIAVDHTDTPVGAVWYRLYSSKERSYGYVDDDTPELGIAIEEAARNKGLGIKLMNSILEEANNDGFKAVSLSVDADNTVAVNLYLRLGFIVVGKDETSYIMLLKF